MTDSPRAIPRRSVVSWILYDMANVIFSMGVISLYFSLYVREQADASKADSTYGAITAVAMGLMFLLSPLLGAMTDRARKRMPFLVWATLVSCAATALLARGPFWVSAILFVIANGGYQAGVQFYDSLLPEVSTDENRGRINGLSVGLGYLGSYIAVGLGFVFGTKDKAILFTAIAALFLLIALPCFLFVHERGNPNPRPIFRASAIAESLQETWRTLRAGKRFPGLLRFLIGRAFYTDAINTVISFMSLYTVNVAISTGLSAADGEKRAQFVLMSAITAAILGGVAWGFVVDRIGPKKTLTIILGCWTGTFTVAACVGFLHLPIGWLYLVACVAGISLGGTWASDRPYMLRLTPPDRVGEFYGLYGMVGRFSAVTGPALWGLTTYITVERMGMPALTGQAFAIVTLLAMVLVSIVILRPVTDEKRDWAALEAAAQGT
ncbi:MAG: MFS transporter [Gemmatimonadetes bacterium]|nr:MFS transporter [Gemmatimonadota bacterium]MBI3568308.1 MFS transporter [Gemmatimonadota bacterium]